MIFLLAYLYVVHHLIFLAYCNAYAYKTYEYIWKLPDTTTFKRITNVNSFSKFHRHTFDNYNIELELHIKSGTISLTKTSAADLALKTIKYSMQFGVH